MKFKAATIQMSSTANMEENISTATKLIEKAAAAGADLLTLPENIAIMPKATDEIFTHAYFSEDHPALKSFQNCAKSLGKAILIGSLAVKVKNSEKLANRSFYINDNGDIIGHYDKIHLFDATIKNGESHKESARFVAGNKMSLIDTDFGKLGMTICYDLRFPTLYRKLAQDGAYFITVPAAFTRVTGAAHWHVLLRARAIETGCYIIAPAQCGTHASGRETFGHSLIINPWGEIISEQGNEPGFSIGDIETTKVDEARTQIPSLNIN